MTIAALTRAMEAGRTTALDLTRSALADIAHHDGRLRAFALCDTEGALAQAAAVDEGRSKGATLGPLAGIPVAVSDSLDVAGLPTAEGTALWRGRIPARDAGVVGRLRRAGAVVLGKLAMSEAGWPDLPPADPGRRGDNARWPGHQPGTGAMGAAIAVAAGQMPFAVAGDALGGLRLPAALCGVWALAPSQGLIGRSGVHPLSWTLDRPGLVAANARDLLSGLAIVAGPDADDPFSTDVALLPLRRAGLPGLRLGLVAEAQGATLAAPVARALESAVQRLAGQGALLTTVSVAGWDPATLRQAADLVAGAEAGARFGSEIDRAGPMVSEALRAALAPGRRVSGERLAGALRRIALARPATLWALSDCDALLLPAVPMTAPRQSQPARADGRDLLALASATGLPSLIFPWPVTSSGPPASLQLIGPPGSDARLIALAGAMARTVAG